MKYTSIQHINTLLQNSSIINDVRNKLQQLKELNQAVVSLLPTEASNYCSVANFRDGVLILTTKSPAWKHQINFLKMDLLDQLRSYNSSWAGISSITVTIDYLIDDLDKYQNNSDNNDSINGYNIDKKNSNNQDNKNKNFTISSKTAELINNIVNQEISYEPLAIGLKRLIGKIS